MSVFRQRIIGRLLCSILSVVEDKLSIIGFICLILKTISYEKRPTFILS